MGGKSSIVSIKSRLPILYPNPQFFAAFMISFMIMLNKIRLRLSTCRTPELVLISDVFASSNPGMFCFYIVTSMVMENINDITGVENWSKNWILIFNNPRFGSKTCKRNWLKSRQKHLNKYESVKTIDMNWCLKFRNSVIHLKINQSSKVKT